MAETTQNKTFAIFLFEADEIFNTVALYRQKTYS